MINQSEWQKSIEHTSIVAACLIKNDNKYLLVQENQSKDYGLWNIPAGHVDKGEKIRDAAVREAKEETGYDVILNSEITIIHEEATRAVKHIFSASIIGGDLAIDKDEILDVKWLSYDEVKDLADNDKLRRPWVLDVIKKDHFGNL